MRTSWSLVKTIFVGTQQGWFVSCCVQKGVSPREAVLIVRDVPTPNELLDLTFGCVVLRQKIVCAEIGAGCGRKQAKGDQQYDPHKPLLLRLPYYMPAMGCWWRSLKRLSFRTVAAARPAS